MKICMYIDKEDEQTIQAMIDDVAENGGEYSFTTDRGVVKDIHRTEPHE